MILHYAICILHFTFYILPIALSNCTLHFALCHFALKKRLGEPLFLMLLFFVPIIIRIGICEILYILHAVRYVCSYSLCLILPIGRTACYIPCACIFKRYACQAVAGIERIITNACNTVRYNHTCQAVAGIERPITNACNTVRNNHACQARAGIERTFTNACNTVGDNQACQAAAVSERIITNACNAIGDNHACQCEAVSERPITNACNTVGDNHA